MAKLEELAQGAFSPVDITVWRARVAEELGGRPAASLAGATLDGVPIEPLYAEASAERPDPGTPPFIRGADPARRRPLRLARMNSIEAAANRAFGPAADGLCLELAGDTAALGPLLVRLAGPPAMPAVLDGQNWIVPEVVGALDSWRGEGGHPDRLELAVAGDVLGAFARSGVAADSEPQLIELVAAHAAWAEANAPAVRLAMISTRAYHEAGCGEAQELGFALAAGLWHLRAIVSGGLPVERALRQIGFSVAIGSDVFVELAKLRALRWAWARLIAALPGAPQVAPWLHAQTSARTLSQRDPWTNLLRGTNQSIAALLGGADAITTRPFDEALGAASAHAERIAENTQTVLLEESHLGDVVDPAGGSYFVEALTEELARAGWQTLQEIEGQGGMYAAIDTGAIAAMIAPVADERARRLASRRQGILGVSEYAQLEDPAARPTPRAATAPARGRGLPLRRDAAPFEALRDAVDAVAGARPTVVLACLGPVAEHTVRATFAENFFAAAGLGCRAATGAIDDLAEACMQGEATAPPLICMVGTDGAYAASAAALATALAARGVGAVWLAGRPGEHEAAFRAAGIERFIHLGCDVLDALRSAAARFGAAV